MGDPLMPLLNTNDAVPSDPATLHRVTATSYDPATSSQTYLTVGATAGTTTIIDGTLYVTKVWCPVQHITGIGRVYGAAYTGAGGTGAPTMKAMPVWSWDDAAAQATLLGVVDQVNLSQYGAGALIHTSTTSGNPINWKLPRPGPLYVGDVFSGAAGGGPRVPSGSAAVNAWLTTGTDPLRYAVLATGITTAAAISTSWSTFTAANLSTTNLPNGPMLISVQGN